MDQTSCHIYCLREHMNFACLPPPLLQLHAFIHLETAARFKLATLARNTSSYRTLSPRPACGASQSIRGWKNQQRNRQQLGNESRRNEESHTKRTASLWHSVIEDMAASHHTQWVRKKHSIKYRPVTLSPALTVTPPTEDLTGGSIPWSPRAAADEVLGRFECGNGEASGEVCDRILPISCVDIAAVFVAKAPRVSKGQSAAGGERHDKSQHIKQLLVSSLHFFTTNFPPCTLSLSLT